MLADDLARQLAFGVIVRLESLRDALHMPPQRLGRSDRGQLELEEPPPQAASPRIRAVADAYRAIFRLVSKASMNILTEKAFSNQTVERSPRGGIT